MVSSISRNYISGISSGMDTDNLISQMLEAASVKKYSLERKRNKLSYQQSMLQEINLKLYNLQTKATDLTFSKTFNSKSVESTDSKIISATATTAAKAGTYNVKVKQLATTTSVASKAKLAGSIELGTNISSSGKIGGSGTTLGALGVSPTGLQITTTSSNGQLNTYNVSTNADSDTTIDELISNINSSIKANADLNGKIRATYDDKNNSLKFNLLSNSFAASIKDAGVQESDGLIAKMFGQGAAGSVELNKDVPVKSSVITMKAGAAATLKDLCFTKGTLGITRGGQTESIDMSGLSDDMTVEEFVSYLNGQIDQSDVLSKSGAATGDPKNRTVEFRLDESSGKLRLVSKDSGDTTQLSISDANGGTFVKKLFGNGVDTTVNSTFDGGVVLANETFATPITSGIFTIDGVQINIDPKVDTLQGVLSRITAMTNLNATYDSETDKISFTRKDGSTAPIGVGSSNDTSNFLSVAGMIAGVQDGDTLTASKTLSGVRTASPLDKAGFATSITTGTFSINGVTFSINNTQSQTMDSVIDAINKNEKVGVKAQYNPTTGEFVLTSTETGNRAIAIGSASDTSNFLGAMGLTGAVQNIGQNCIYSIDSLYGGEDQVSQTNNVSDAIEGMTFSFREVTTGAGEAITVKIDTEAAKVAIKDFIELYNEVTTDIYTKLTEKSDKELEGLTDAEKDALDDDDLKTYEKAYKVGLLRGDSTLRNIRSQLRNIVSSVVSGVDSSYNSLAKLGISTGAVGSDYSATRVGTLSITNENALDAALQNEPELVARMFNADSVGQGGKGIARRLKETLDSFTKSDGLLTSRIGRSDSTSNSHMDKEVAALNKQISAQRSKLAEKEEALLKKFSAMEKALSAYQAQSQSLANSLSSLLASK